MVLKPPGAAQTPKTDPTNSGQTAFRDPARGRRATLRRLVALFPTYPSVVPTVSGIMHKGDGGPPDAVQLRRPFGLALDKASRTVDESWVPEGSLAGFVWVGFWGLGGPWGL